MGDGVYAAPESMLAPIFLSKVATNGKGIQCNEDVILLPLLPSFTDVAASSLGSHRVQRGTRRGARGSDLSAQATMPALCIAILIFEPKAAYI